jgi:hypothetical protein
MRLFLRRWISMRLANAGVSRFDETHIFSFDCRWLSGFINT